jgi:hypothetical protein
MNRLTLPSRLLLAILLDQVAWQAGAPAFITDIILIAITVLTLLLLASSIRAGDYFLPAVSLCALWLILSAPLLDWDARSIWFFHAKRLFYDGSLYARGDDYAGFSHNDYPNLVPALAATIARAGGMWNEILPKLAIFFILLPPFAFLMQTMRSFPPRALALLFMLICLHDYLSSGSMDGILALYAAALLVHLSHIPATQAPDYQTPLMVAALCGLKNEGIAFALIAVFFHLVSLRIFQHPSLRKCAALLFIAFLPAAAWEWFLWHRHIGNYLLESNLPPTARALGRLNMDTLHTILGALTGDLFLWTQIPIVFLSLAFYASTWLIPGNRQGKCLVLAVTGSYTLVLFTVYLITPLDLGNHLATSATRVMMPVTLSLALCALTFWIHSASSRPPCFKERGGSKI